MALHDTEPATSSPSLIKLDCGAELITGFRGGAGQEIWGVERGLGLALRGVDIVGEGMGIGGVVALNRGDTYFALDSQERKDDRSIEKRLYLNCIFEKHLGGINVDRLYRPVWATLSPIYISSSLFRPLYNYLMYARTLLIKQVQKRCMPIGHVELRYRVGRDTIDVQARWSLEGQVIVANELSGRLFDELIVDGTEVRLRPWMELRCKEAELRSRRIGLSMVVRGIGEAALFCGREVIGRRLDWAGFSYLPLPGVRSIEYSVRLRRYD